MSAHYRHQGSGQGPCPAAVYLSLVDQIDAKNKCRPQAEASHDRLDTRYSLRSSFWEQPHPYLYSLSFSQIHDIISDHTLNIPEGDMHIQSSCPCPCDAWLQ